MTTDAPTFTQTIDLIRGMHNVRRVTASDDGSRVDVVVAVGYTHCFADYEGEDRELSLGSEALFLDIQDRLESFDLAHMDTVTDDSESDPGDHHAVEIWFFVRY